MPSGCRKPAAITGVDDDHDLRSQITQRESTDSAGYLQGQRQGRNRHAGSTTRDSGWTHTGKRRPPFAHEPGPGQESVWDYPRPPIVVPDSREVLIKTGDQTLALSNRAVRVLETASAPTFYLPREDVEETLLIPMSGHSFCEWKGRAEYFELAAALERGTPVAWTYPEPFPEFGALADWYAFYPDRVACFVAGERARPQAGGFYGGWITQDVVGPFKGDPGTAGW